MEILQKSMTGIPQDETGTGIPLEKTVMEILQMMGIPQENTVMGIPLMEIPQKTVMGFTQEKTVMGIPQSSHH